MDRKQEKITRPPVVVVVGHIDHGKSSLLEAIREDFRITSRESGGITQHIGAYQAEYDKKKITFLDTPGHEAFSAMRNRGTMVADIAVLVVDAAEGVHPQTKEAAKFIKQAGIPVVVALNKIDKPQAQPEKVKKELAQIDLIVESLGGKIPSVNVSAKTKQGLKDLLETILILAQIEDLKAEVSCKASGTVIESWLDSKKGPQATLLIKEGTLKVNDIIGTPSAVCKVKDMEDFQGKKIKLALPSQPVKVLGFENTPMVGENFNVYESYKQAKEKIVGQNDKKESGGSVLIEENKKIINIVLKTDVTGSGEAIEETLQNIPQEKVALRILENKVGNIDFSDIKLAESGKAKIFGFRVKINQEAKIFARQRKVSYKIFDVIYDLIQEIRREMAAKSEAEIKRVDLGKIKIIAIFKQTKNEHIIGGKIIAGYVERNSLAEVIREDELIGKGSIKTLQQEKRDIQQAGKGKEIGILFKGDIEIKEGDILQVYKEEKFKSGY